LEKNTDIDVLMSLSLADIVLVLVFVLTLITDIVLGRRFRFMTINFKVTVDLTKLAFDHSFRLIALKTLLLVKLLNVLFSCSFCGIGNRQFFNDGYSLLCLLRLDGLVLDEHSFDIDDENFIKTIRTRKTMRTIGEVYDLWSLLF